MGKNDEKWHFLAQSLSALGGMEVRMSSPVYVSSTLALPNLLGVRRFEPGLFA